VLDILDPKKVICAHWAHDFGIWVVSQYDAGLDPSFRIVGRH
jgi:hypothetical protein